MREAADFEHGADHTWQASTTQLAPNANLEVPALNILQYVFPRWLWLLVQGGMIRMARNTSNINQAESFELWWCRLAKKILELSEQLFRCIAFQDDFFCLLCLGLGFANLGYRLKRR